MNSLYLYDRWASLSSSALLVNLSVCAQEVAVPEVLYEEVIEVDERVVLRQDGCQLPTKNPKRIVTGAKENCLKKKTYLR